MAELTVKLTADIAKGDGLRALELLRDLVLAEWAVRDIEAAVGPVPDSEELAKVATKRWEAAFDGAVALLGIDRPASLWIDPGADLSPEDAEAAREKRRQIISGHLENLGLTHCPVCRSCVEAERVLDPEDFEPADDAFDSADTPLAGVAGVAP